MSIKGSTVVVALAIICLAGCASTYRGYGYSGVIIDENGVDMDEFYKDLAECEGYAAKVNKSRRAVGSAAEDAVVGGVIGAIFDGSSGAARGAGTGAVLGGVSGARSAEYEMVDVVRNCLAHRGYRILN